MSEAELFPVEGLERSFHPWIPHSKRPRGRQQAAEATPSANAQSTYTSGRKQACGRCAKRRRKCDSQLPSCTPCRKAKLTCHYPPVNPGSASKSLGAATKETAQASSHKGDDSHDLSLGIEPVQEPQIPAPTFNEANALPSIENGLLPDLDFNDVFFSQPYMWPAVPFGLDNWNQNNENEAQFQIPATSDNFSAGGVGDGLSLLQDAEVEGERLPGLAARRELLDIFFLQYHRYLPCLHRQSIYSLVEDAGPQSSRSPLILALFAVASRSHMSAHISNKREEWHHQAKQLWQSTLTFTESPTRSLQAAVWILFADITSAEINESWLFLGTASRYASMTGTDRVDCSSGANLPNTVLKPRDLLDWEERRRSMWALYVIDKKLSSLCGMPLAIDDRMFNVNYPVDEEAFQRGDVKASPQRFTVDLTALIGPATLNSDSQLSMYEIVLRSVVLLGQITLYHGIHQAGQSDGDRTEFFDRIEGALTRFSLALSRFDVATIALEDLEYAVWLHVTVQTCIILFYHPKVTQCVLTGTRGAHKAPITLPPSLQRSANAVENLIRLVKDTTPRSTEALLHPFFLGAFFLCCRFKLIMWKTFRSPKHRDDLDMMIMLVDQFTAKWGVLGQKYQDKIKRDLKTADEEIERDHRL